MPQPLWAVGVNIQQQQQRSSEIPLVGSGEGRMYAYLITTLPGGRRPSPEVKKETMT